MMGVGVTPLATAAPITVDGSIADWASVPITASDPFGDVPDGDLLSVSFTVDGGMLYFLVQLFASGSAPKAVMFLDTDRNAGTGYPILGVGMEYGVTLVGTTSNTTPGNTYIGDARDGAWEPSNFPGALTAVYGSAFIEGSVPLSTLAVLTPGFDGEFRFQAQSMFGDNLDAPGTFSPIVVPSVPEPTSMILFGTGLLGLAAWRRRLRGNGGRS